MYVHTQTQAHGDEDKEDMKERGRSRCLRPRIGGVRGGWNQNVLNSHLKLSKSFYKGKHKLLDDFNQETMVVSSKVLVTK